MQLPEKWQFTERGIRSLRIAREVAMKIPHAMLAWGMKSSAGDQVFFGVEMRFIEIGFFRQFLIKGVIAHSLHQRRLLGKQVDPQAQTVTVDGAAHGRQGGGEHVQGTELPLLRFVGGGGRIDEAVIDVAAVVFVHIPAEIAFIHRAVVAGDDHRGVFVKILSLKPLKERRHLPAGTGDHIFIVFFVFVTAVGAGIATYMVGIHGEHGKSEGLLLLRNLGECLLGIFKQVQILHAPPYKVVIGYETVLPGGGQVVDFVYAMGIIVGFPTAEGGIGAYHQGLVVAVFFQDSLQIGKTGKEMAVFAVAVLPVGDPIGDFQGDAGGMTYHSADGPAGAGYLPEAADPIVMGEIDVILRQLIQFRDQIVFQSTALFLRQIAGLHRFQHNIDQIPLFFGEGDLGVFGVPVLLLVDFGAAGYGDDIIHQLHIKGGVDYQDQAQNQTDAGSKDMPGGEVSQLFPGKEQQHTYD